MNKLFIVILGLSVSWISAGFSQTEYQNSLPLSILNTTGQPGFFGTCSGKISPNGSTICSTPQYIEKGAQTILVPSYPDSYPVFSTDGNNLFSCATLQTPDAQLFFSPQDIRANTLILESLIPDTNGNDVAILCGLQPKQ